MQVRLAVLLLALVLALPTATAVSLTPATTPPPGSGGSTNGTLILDVTPATATVLVNGSAVPIGNAGTATVPLPPGTYAVTVTASGYAAFTGNVTVATAQTAYLTVHLVSNPPPSGGSGLKLSSFTVVVTATIVGAVAVVVLGIFLWRRPRTSPDGAGTATADSPADEGPE
jgi:hypothetical protein